VQKWLSYTMPYVGVATLLFVAVYILFKAVVEAGDPAYADSLRTRDILREVARYATILFGVTVAARVPRLSRDTRLRMAAIAVAALTCVVYYLSEPSTVPHLWFGLEFPAGTGMVALAMVVIALAFLAGSVFPLQGVTPLMGAGMLVVAGIVLWHVVPELSGLLSKLGILPVAPAPAAAARAVTQTQNGGALWPVFLATGGFLYLWWLAALLFDLVVIWHWYIRNEQILTRMDEIAGGKRGGIHPEPTGPAPESRDHAPQVQT
jgi:hypothetical protein